MQWYLHVSVRPIPLTLLNIQYGSALLYKRAEITPFLIHLIFSSHHSISQRIHHLMELNRFRWWNTDVMTSCNRPATYDLLYLNALILKKKKRKAEWSCNLVLHCVKALLTKSYHKAGQPRQKCHIPPPYSVGAAPRLLCWTQRLTALANTCRT